jgi:hypothetical protein
LFLPSFCLAENYLLNGGQKSVIDYQMEQEVVPAPGTKKLVLSYVIPKSFRSPSYNQQVESFHIHFSIKPFTRERELDSRGNEVMRAIWMNPVDPVIATISLKTQNFTNLDPIETKASFPLIRIPSDIKVYLEPTKQVPSDNPTLVELSQRLTENAETQFDAVQQILTWVVDYLNYIQRPKDFGAVYSVNTRKGNCQNYSHLSATLMRAAGIPVRIVNGVTLKEPYHVKISGGYFTMRMAQGRHSWIEIFFPDLGWVPFDPQQMELFVSNRFIRVEIGLDNEETVNDGTVMWTRYHGTSGYPKFRETIQVDFLQDMVDLFAERQSYGPRKLLFSPPVESYYARLPFEESEAVSVPNLIEDLATLEYKHPFEFGNLEFPEHIDFYSVQGEVKEEKDGTMVLTKSFLVETSEYVTTQGQKYAQSFILEDPVHLIKVGLALRQFGGKGQLWIELMEDDGSGKPGTGITSSEIILLSQFPQSDGYQWIDFLFDNEPVYLSPGRFWIALGYTGSPIVNWFFSYGKNVGPSDGTCYYTLFDDNWGHNLTYEFNFRIVGLKAGK